MSWFLGGTDEHPFDCSTCPAFVREERACPRPSRYELDTIRLHSAPDLPLFTCPRNAAQRAPWTSEYVRAASHYQAHGRLILGDDDATLRRLELVLRTWQKLDAQRFEARRKQAEAGAGARPGTQVFVGCPDDRPPPVEIVR